MPIFEELSNSNPLVQSYKCTFSNETLYHLRNQPLSVSFGISYQLMELKDAGWNREAPPEGAVTNHMRPISFCRLHTHISKSLFISQTGPNDNCELGISPVVNIGAPHTVGALFQSLCGPRVAALCCVISPSHDLKCERSQERLIITLPPLAHERGCAELNSWHADLWLYSVRQVRNLKQSANL